ncbi:hypothetical protein AFR_03550 [Actinoplanes friuliensis DSM 7358]|uniref:Uncharacterized protein n=1 Tax=Actinoplanes friuliensis DSM 7358 TaxID=1246995 RepID=U5VQB3_9ACTN|nr:hypothetical protein AFR_03550 [Actinoplanes friuliensis DSM 7358]
MLAVLTAMLVNQVIYTIGRAVGGTFEFTAAGRPAEVFAITVAGFSAVPMLLGLLAVALLAPRFGWVTWAALIVGPVLAIATIFVMTLPADFDTASKVALSLCHLTLAPIIIVAVRALDRGTTLAPAPA